MVEIKETVIDEALEVHRFIPEFVETKADRETFEKRLDGRDHVVMTAYVDGKAAGYIIGYDRDEDGSFYCWMAAVRPEYRRMGLLTSLMNGLKLWMQVHQYRIMRIKTRNSRREMLMYLVKNGFDIIGVEEVDDVHENRIELEKAI